LQILEYIADQDQPVRLAELAELLGIEKSTGHRLANTLADRGYLRQDPETSAYVLSEKVIAAIGISGPVERVNKTSMKEIGQVVKECAAELSGELGHQG